jgi:hypothetical protein
VNQPIAIKDLIKKVVQKTSEQVYPPGPAQTTVINFLHGHPLEVLASLEQMNQDSTTKDKKYPLIALFHDFKEKMNPRVGIYADVTLNIIIANFTESQLTAPERYDVNFYPVLYPIYAAFMKQLTRSGYFMSYPDGLQPDKWDRLFWGKDGLYGKEGNIFNDFIDAIEIQNLNLSIDQKICKSWQP